MFYSKLLRFLSARLELRTVVLLHNGLILDNKAVKSRRSEELKKILLKTLFNLLMLFKFWIFYVSDFGFAVQSFLFKINSIRDLFKEFIYFFHVLG